MSYELDLLRQTRKLVVPMWRWIIGVTVFTALPGLLGAVLVPRDYMSEALIIVTEQNANLQFDDRFQNLPDSDTREVIASLYQVAAAIADSDATLQSVLAEPPPSNEAWPDFKTLQDSTSVVITNGNSVVRLRVITAQPNASARIANQWATTTLAQLASLYSKAPASSEPLDERLQQLEKELDQYRDELLAFRGRDTRATLNERLQAIRETYQGIVLNQYEMQILRSNIALFLVYLSQLDANEPADFGNALLTSQFQEQTFFYAPSMSSPYTLEFDAAQLPSKTVGELITLNTYLQELIDQRVRNNTELLSTLEDENQRLSVEVDALNTEFSLINSSYERSLLNYNTVQNKISEDETAREVVESRFRLGAAAVIPVQAYGLARSLWVLIAVFVGLCLGIGSALIRAYILLETTRKQDLS